MFFCASYLVGFTDSKDSIYSVSVFVSFVSIQTVQSRQRVVKPPDSSVITNWQYPMFTSSADMTNYGRDQHSLVSTHDTKYSRCIIICTNLEGL